MYTMRRQLDCLERIHNDSRVLAVHGRHVDSNHYPMSMLDLRKGMRPHLQLSEAEVYKLSVRFLSRRVLNSGAGDCLPGHALQWDNNTAFSGALD